MSQSILALDLALHAGYAHWAVGLDKPRAGLLEINKHQELGGRLAQLYRWLLRVTKEWSVTDICVESPLVGNGETPGKETQFFWLIGCYAVTSMLGAQTGINVVAIANSTMFVHWCGSINDANGERIPKKQRKTYSLLEAQRRGFKNITSHDTADALGLLSLRCAMLNLSPPWDFKRSPGPLFTKSHAPAGIKITKQNRIAANVAINKGLSFDRSKP